MFIILVILEIAAIGVLIAEIWLGIAVAGWQGERPYVIRSEQPFHFWCLIVVHALFGLGLPALLLSQQ